MLRLPPHSEATGAARCWRRHFSAPRDGVSNLSSVDWHTRQLLLQHRRFRTCDGALRSLGVATVQGLPGTKCRETGVGAKGDVVGKLSGNDTMAIATAGTCTKRAALFEVGRFEPRSSRTAAALLRSTRARASSPFLQVLGTVSCSALGSTWSQQQAHWQTLRGFASVPPEQPDSRTDTHDHNSRRALPGQRAFLGGLLKPSDVSSTAAKFFSCLCLCNVGLCTAINADSIGCPNNRVLGFVAACHEQRSEYARSLEVYMRTC